MCKFEPHHLLLRTVIEHRFMAKPDASAHDLSTYLRLALQIHFYSATTHMFGRQLGSRVHSVVSYGNSSNFVKLKIQTLTALTRTFSSSRQVREFPALDYCGLTQDAMPAGLDRQRPELEFENL
jgi:hypothetical protein